ncbi:MAG: hypothetical protein ACI83D_000540 [Planctomycetota bacterium]|jgi:uncharacterized protein (TIGR00730 family)
MKSTQTDQSSNHIQSESTGTRSLSKMEVLNMCIHTKETHARIAVINDEIHMGICFVDSFDKSVTFFGSARFKEDNFHYQQAKNLAFRISKDLGFAIVSGGGPGIMEAANRGAYEAGGESLGLTIKLPSEQTTNPYVGRNIGFHYFFTRKVALTFSAEVYVYFPGGFGTLDELFEILTLVQTGKIEPVPIILVGRDFWGPLDYFIKQSLLDLHQTINPEDVNLYTITDDEEEMMSIIEKAPIRKNATLPPEAPSDS